MKRLAAILLLLASPVLADDWPQFRGPGGSGASAEKELPLEWSKDRGLRWTADLPGRGLSGPVVVGGRVYVTASGGFEDGELRVLCFDAASGKKLWTRSFIATGPTLCNGKTCMAAPTPAAGPDGTVYALFATGDLVALDRDGNYRWARSLCLDYPTIGNNVGMAASPVLAGSVLLIAMENTGESFAAGLDAATGRNLWKDARAAKINWTTPCVFEAGGRTQALFQSGDEITAYDPLTGVRLWNLAGKFSTIPSATAGEGLLFVPGGPSVALRPAAGSASKAWDGDRLPSATASPAFYRGRLYTVNSAGVVTCADAKDGAVLWKERTPAPHSASPVFAEDRLYLANEKGVTTVLGLGGPEAKILATNDLADPIIATPAISGGAIFLRSERKLYCAGRKGE
jgi:outer membrane protein assembly factor BamB